MPIIMNEESIIMISNNKLLEKMSFQAIKHVENNNIKKYRNCKPKKLFKINCL